jgi:hypothetical protein
MLVGAFATGQEPASNRCNGHHYDKNKELFARPFIDVKVEVNGQTVTAGDEPLDLGYACVGGMIEFKVTASDKDALDCDIHETTERVSNYMRNTTVQVKVSMDADTVYCTLPLISPEGSDMTFTRTWTHSWTIPPQAVGRTLLFEFVGLVSDVKCDAHPASHDPDFHLNAPDEGYLAEIAVVDFIRLAASAPGGPQVESVTAQAAPPPPTADNTLFLAEDHLAGTAQMILTGDWLPDGAPADKFRWDIVLTNGTAGATEWSLTNSAFVPNPATVTWNAANASGSATNRQFLVRGWYDCNANGQYEAAEPHRSLYVTIIKVDKVPLGGSANLSTFIIGKVYVPTKWGGDLKLSGSNVELFYTDGSDLDCDTAIKIFKGELNANRVAQGSPCSYTVPADKHKWYYAKITAASATAISATFKQSASAGTRPWNFYWWASKGDYIREPDAGGNGTANSTKLAGSDDVQVVASGGAVAAGADIIRCGNDGDLQSAESPDDEKRTLTNLFDPGGALAKYDTACGTTAKAWEAANGQGSAEWWGHCLGAAMASVLLDQPSPTAASTLSIDELEGLWAELGEKSGIYTIPDGFGGCPAGPPAAGADGTDAYAGKCHRVLEQYIKGAAVSLQSNLRSDGGAATEVWNHAVWKYDAVYEEAAGGNEKVVEITVDLAANEDHTPPTNDVGDRDIKYVYILEYKDAGTVDEGAAANDWISVGGDASYALGNLLRVTGAAWGGDNPHVTEANVKSLDTANQTSRIGGV